MFSASLHSSIAKFVMKFFEIASWSELLAARAMLSAILFYGLYKFALWVFK
jgi:hypothetical protein